MPVPGVFRYQEVLHQRMKAIKYNVCAINKAKWFWGRHNHIQKHKEMYNDSADGEDLKCIWECMYCTYELGTCVN